MTPGVKLLPGTPEYNAAVAKIMAAARGEIPKQPEEPK